MNSDLIGRRLGPYEILEYIGQGGMAEVYRAYHPELAREVAVKIIGRGRESDAVFNARFRREARAIARLKHPNIVQVYDFGLAEGGHYMVMEYVEGGYTLAHLLYSVRQGEHRLEPADIAFLVRQVGAALDHAHLNGVIHRDVKPANILLSRTGQAILTDFGLALLHSRSMDDYSSGTAFGTPEYMSPEQVSDSRAAGPASDLYSLGVVLFEMVTGELPFEANSAVDVALRHLTDTAPDPRLLNEDVAPSVAAVVRKALAKSPRDRFKSGMQLATALEYAFAHPEYEDFLSGFTAASPTPTAAEALGQPDIVVNRGPSALERRDEIKRLEEERSRQLAEEQRAEAAVRRAQRLARRQQFFTRWGTALGVAVFMLLAVAGGFYGLQALGIISIRTQAPPALGEALAAEATATATATPTPTLTPTATPTFTPTPLRPVTATPVPPQALAVLGPGSSAFRVFDGTMMQFVPAGQFLMGTSDRSRNLTEQPQHQVALSHYWLDRTEITNGQYRACQGAGACPPPTDTRYIDDPAFDSFPVNFITYDSAAAYCLWLAGQSGQPIGLPTEAQWEKAASWQPDEQIKLRYPWGNGGPSPSLMRYNESNLPQPMAAVGSYPEGASPYGVLDLAGNVWEWTADWFDPEAYQREGLPTDPGGPLTGTLRVTRGGSWTRGSFLAITTVRSPVAPTTSNNEIGFRCAMSVERPPLASGIYLSPLDLTGALLERLAAEREDPANDIAAIDGWQEGILAIQIALQAGQNSAAQPLIEERLAALETQASGDAPLLRPGLVIVLRNGMRWMQLQLQPAPEPTPPPEPVTAQ